MSFEHWLAFVAASAVLLAIPGPTVLLNRRRRAGRGLEARGGLNATPRRAQRKGPAEAGPDATVRRAPLTRLAAPAPAWPRCG